MDASGTDSDAYGGGSSNSRRQRILSASNIIQVPISALLEYSGLLRTSRSIHQESPLIPNPNVENSTSSLPNNGHVAIRIIGAEDQHESDRDASGMVVGQLREVTPQSEVFLGLGTSDGQGGNSRSSDLGVATGEGEGVSYSSSSGSVSADAESGDGSGSGVNNNRDSSYQRYDIQQAARWIEQVLPFSLLLLVVFIRQHLQGFFVTIWIAAVMFKSNDILRKQTALKGERKISVLTGFCLAFTLHVMVVYWWYWNDDLLYPLVMLPPKYIPPFWHAIFIIMVNDTLVRQEAMVLKCFLLMYYKNCRGRNYRKQGQMLTLVEYMMLLYRALLPTPVWYRFFLNKDYGSLFSSLMTGLYLTFKLTSVVEKVQSFFAALKALSRKEVHYGAYATSEQVNAAGDLCAICQEKMHAPILLRCKHIFCEDCVSEWFERERTCPLCRALVKPADLRSFGDGSTSLFFQIF
ncbi:RING finger and transmembrane domain-containing protein 2-like isoform X2 [Hibiscus syriacus]|uniref:RING finger and transmembrane domain-containing protein 2-like isoform X2 n=1 Tax=Hibiscus syriacus TaxID=106335 RepID=A0A6A3CGK8_HIBSY|nr:E3 ubiquitin-protein ligase RNFT1-like isoform X1 [Hibiscus syriacus]XP_039056160.1 E3 ubiquitin-protein ligase RNFT1-like isoform X1 [Hibiscus syriacus]KAE8727867.1 RING finger and transmembrane domain-containing protein 2-like isoform X2 [Hibiscus syriacus]